MSEPKYKVGDVLLRTDDGDAHITDRRVLVKDIYDPNSVNGPLGKVVFDMLSVIYKAEPGTFAYGCVYADPSLNTETGTMAFFENELKEI